MAAFTLQFDMGNAAFDDGHAPAECEAILTLIARKVAMGSDSGYIHDSNGNKIGEWSADYPPCEEDDHEH